MHRAAIIIICSAALSSCAPGAGGGSGPTVTTPTAPKDVPAAVQAKWAVVWADEFTDATLDAANWIVADGTANVNNELEYYTPSDVYLENGALVLRSQRRSMGGRAYTSGEVRTGAKRTVGIGSAVEWRTQSPSGKGIWPANWLVNTLCDGLNGCGANWPPEIDVMELRGSLPDVNLMTHWWGTYPNAQHQTTEYSGTPLSVGFHTYRVEWFADSVLWYVDGTQRAKHASNVTAGILQLVMNTAVGGDFDGPPTSSTVFPQYHRIDYVRVYRDTANVY